MMFQNDRIITDYDKGYIITKTDISLYGLAYVEGQEMALSLVATDEYMRGYKAAVEERKNR
jgi:hypothetical protein